MAHHLTVKVAGGLRKVRLTGERQRHRMYWNILGYTGIYWDILLMYWICWDILGYTIDILKCTGYTDWDVLGEEVYSTYLKTAHKEWFCFLQH